MSHERESKTEGKGFAGLSSLVSDVDVTSPSAPCTQSASVAPDNGNDLLPTRSLPTTRPGIEEPTQSSAGGSSEGKWMVGLALAIIGVLWLVGEFDATKTPNVPTQSPPARISSPSDSSQIQWLPASQPRSLPRPTESKPPVAQSLVLSREQIRYCLAEDIRLDGARSAINTRIDYDVDRFNAMVNDYNSRCGNFRYRNNALKDAQRDLDPFRSQIQLEGRSRFTQLASESPAASVYPDATVQAVQRRLNELGYEAGPPDGLMGRRTRSAILSFQKDMGMTQDGQADRDLLAVLNMFTPAENR